MLVLSCVVILAILSVNVSCASSNQDQFWCGLPNVKRCVDKANNLTECNCTDQNERYCPSNNSCVPLDSNNAGVCWENASCTFATTKSMTTVSSLTASNVTKATTTSMSTVISSTASYVINASHTVPIPSETTIPTLTSKPTKFYSLDTDYSPIIIAVAAGFGGFIVFVCCMCAVHSWWLKRKKFTDVNSTPLSKIEKKRKKQELLEARMREALEEKRQGKEPSKFDMAYTKPQKVNERALANYDWARTSYLPGMLEPTAHDQNPSGSIPKLICDDDDSDFDDPNELGDDNIAFEHGKEDPREVESPSMSSLFSPVDELELQPQEPVIVEPEMFDSLAEIPRPPPDGDMVGSKGVPPSQDYVTMMGRF